MLAIGADTGIVTCGIFGSIMWWPEAELRSSFEAAGLSLPGEQGAPNTHMSKLLRRYFTPSSAALAQATLQQMHSSGRLQGSEVTTTPALLENSVDLDAQADSVADGEASAVDSNSEPVKAGPPPITDVEPEEQQQQQELQQSWQQQEPQQPWQQQQQEPHQSCPQQGQQQLQQPPLLQQQLSLFQLQQHQGK